MQQDSVLKNIIALWRYLGKKRQLQFTLLLILMLVTVFAEIISIGAVIPFLSALTKPESLMTLTWFEPVIKILKIQTADELLLPLTLGFIAATIFSAGARILLLWANGRLTAAMGIQLSTEIYTRTLYQPYEYHVAQNSSQLVSMVTQKVGAAIQVGIMHVLMLVSASIMSTAIITTLLIVNTQVAVLAFLILGGGYVLTGYLARKRIKRNGEIIAKNQPLSVKCMQEGLGGIRDIIMDNSQEVFSNLYAEVTRNMQIAGMKNGFLSGLPKSLLEMLGITLIAGLAYWLQINSSGQQAAIPVLGALALGAQRLLPSLQQIYFSWSHINGHHAILAEVTNQLEPVLSSSNTHHQPFSPMVFRNHISLQHLYFCYAGTEVNVLKDVCLTINKGSRVGFMGTTGSGKSTLSDIIMGLLLPTQGQLVIDDLVINANNIGAWQRNIAHVPQNIFLADTSMAENIAFGVPIDKIDLVRVKQAAKDAQISVFIEGLTDGYQAFVGERGIRLSGGQRQRIGIARALYKQASVIVFDEATSALDNETEASVMEAINSLDKDLTVIIIAHRLSTLKECDVIYKLDKGAVYKSGPYEQVAMLEI